MQCFERFRKTFMRTATLVYYTVAYSVFDVQYCVGHRLMNLIRKIMLLLGEPTNMYATPYL